MINKYAGNCQCGARVEPGQGEALKVGGKWIVRCAPTTEGNTQVFCSAYEQKLPAVSEPVQALLSSEEEYTLLSGHKASPYQAAVFDHFRYGRGSRIIKAVAGSGKTTTMKNAVRFLPHSHHVKLLAFNTEAADQLAEAIVELEEKGYIKPGHHIDAGTFHSTGMRALMRFLQLPKGVVKVEDGSAKTRKLMRTNIGTTPEGEEICRLYTSYVSDLVRLAKGVGIGCEALAPDTDERWWQIIDHHGLYLDSAEATPEMGIEIARRVMRWSEAAARQGWLDYDDQLYLVIRWKLRLWQHHEVILDEAQDTNEVRRAIAKLLLLPGGRLYAVGDPMQSIYGFTGADVDAMDLIARDFNTQELPLTVSYRCSKTVIERAQTWVPYIQHSEFAPEGEVLDEVPLHAALGMLTAQDAILCRQTAPLVSIAYGLIARGRPCRILGREIGEGLVNLIEQQKAKGIEGLFQKLAIWRDREMAKFTAKGEEQRAEAVKDRVECILVIIDAMPEGKARTVPALIAKIQSMFVDPVKGEKQTILTLCTAHKAKGKEWDRVAILRPELMPSKAARQDWQYEQEINLQYVACTRAKLGAYYVAEKDMTIDAPREAKA